MKVKALVKKMRAYKSGLATASEKTVTKILVQLRQLGLS